MARGWPVTVFLLLAGCGSTATPPTAEQPTRAPASAVRTPMMTSPSPTETRRPKPAKKPKAASPSPGEAPAKFTDPVDRENYRIAFEICRLSGVAKVAREFRTAVDPFEAAEGYAAGYRPNYRQANFEGCLDGFKAAGEL